MGLSKDTLINRRASGELVINAVTEAIVHAATACAENLPPHRSEFGGKSSVRTSRLCLTPVSRPTAARERFLLNLDSNGGAAAAAGVLAVMNQSFAPQDEIRVV